MTNRILLHIISALLIPVLLFALFLFSFSRREPPSSADQREFLDQHREDIDLLVAYLMDLEYEDVFMDKRLNHDPGKVFYELAYHDISSPEVEAGVRRLWRAGCLKIRKDDRGENNTIFFELWSRTVGGENCGIALTINGQGTPKTEFQILHEEIGDGWFYVYNDDEEYRCHPKQYEENQPWITP